MKKNKLYTGLLYLLIFSLPLISCEDQEEVVKDYSRLFRPPKIEASVTNTSVSISWTAVGEGIYKMELSRDSLLFINDLQEFDIEGKSSYTLSDLYGQTLYSARIKAVSSNPNVQDSEYQSVVFTTGVENISYTIAEENINANSVLLKWEKGTAVTHIIASTKGRDDIVVNLMESDIQAGQKLIEGLLDLQNGCPYQFTLYLNERIRGIVKISPEVKTIEVDQISNGNEWYELGAYYFSESSGSYIQIKNDNTNGYVIADAIKLSRDGFDDIIIDSEDSNGNVVITGDWSSSSGSNIRIGANYLHDGNSNKGSKSVKYSFDIPESGLWTVYMYWAKSSNRASNVPVDIFSGNL